MDRNKIKFYIERILAFLRARAPIGGLEISDSALRFSQFDGKKWQFTSIRLPPGLMDMNRIKNSAEFVELLKKLHSQITGERKHTRKVNVIVSLSSISIYSQVFGLPIVRGDNLEKAVQLNIQMVSPVEVKEAYSGWQLVGEDKDTFRLEVLSAFIDRTVVDDVTSALEEGGFSVVAIESRALALVRLFREKSAGLDLDRPYILINLDSSGMDFLVIRRRQLYFEYFKNWKDAQNEKQQVTREAFEALLIRSLYQVLNFYSKQWPEPVKGVLVSAVSLGDQVSQIVKNNFNLPVETLSLAPDMTMSTDWFVPVGSALRGLARRSEDRDISLLGIGAQERFRQEQVVTFASFWGIIIPVVLGILLIAFVISDAFLINLRRSFESQSSFQLKSQDLAEIGILQAEAARFNQTVSLLKAANEIKKPKHPILNRLMTLVKDNKISLSRVYFQGSATPSILSGSAQSEENILEFKKALDSDPLFTSVQLPLADIKASVSNFYFTISFFSK